jgi:hypothetical protein
MNGVYSGGIFGLSGNCFLSSPWIPVGHQPFLELRRGFWLVGSESDSWNCSRVKLTKSLNHGPFRRISIEMSLSGWESQKNKLASVPMTSPVGKTLLRRNP